MKPEFNAIGKYNRDLGFIYNSARNPQDCYSLHV
jgi:hypothetical protein